LQKKKEEQSGPTLLLDLRIRWAAMHDTRLTSVRNPLMSSEHINGLDGADKRKLDRSLDRGSLEDCVLVALCWSENLAPKFAHKIGPGDFSTAPYKRIAAVAIDFVESHHRPGRMHIYDILEPEIRRGDADGVFLSTLCTEMEERLWPNLNEQYVASEFDKFVETQRLTAAVSKVGELLYAGKLEEAQSMLLSASQVEPGAALGILPMTKFQGEPVPEQGWLVPEWIPQRRATGVYGVGAIGKTTLLQQLMTCAALGERWLGCTVAPCRSLGLFSEDDEDEVHRRQENINRLYCCDFADLADMELWPRWGRDNLLMVFGQQAKGELTRLWQELREAALDRKAKVIVIDTLADTFGGNENDRGQVRQFVQMALNGLARAIEGSVVVSAHPSQSGINDDTGTSGSTMWDAGFRSRLYLARPKTKGDDDEPHPDSRVLTRKKANYAAVGDKRSSILLRWESGVLTTNDNINTLHDRRVCEEVFMTILSDMIKQDRPVSANSHSGNYAPKLFTRHPSRDGYRVADFERAMEALLARGAIRLETYKNEYRNVVQRLVLVEA
jgi:RecA-family ATPase